MIEKSEESKSFFKRDPCNKKSENKTNHGQEQEENEENSSFNIFGL